ncbi:MAG: MerR family transcriptional regulator, partial [Deltaproteobacteria bacterium]
MRSDSESRTISSKEVMARTGISRATLNNYISLNLIPPPTIRRPEEPGGPTKIGYFPLWVLDRIEKIRELKAAGIRISEIAAHFSDAEPELPVTESGGV